MWVFCVGWLVWRVSFVFKVILGREQWSHDAMSLLEELVCDLG